MPLAHLFPSFPPERIVYDDEDVIVIDKPVDVSTHAPDAGRTDDAFSRLRLALAERDGVPVDQIYLGIHQRLDRDTSGVLLFTRRRSANPNVAAEFEGRHVQKTYVAVVEGWPKRLEKGVLRDELAPAEGGRMQVVPPAERGPERVAEERARSKARPSHRDPSHGAKVAGRGAKFAGRGAKVAGRGAKVAGRGTNVAGRAPNGAGRGAVGDFPKGSRLAKRGERRGTAATPETKRSTSGKTQIAVTHYRVLRRDGTRALIELSPETGRTHQLRVQLASAGGAIAGDRLYQGAPAARLMLHASRLELRHPTSGARLDVHAPVPPELEQWLVEPRLQVGAGDPLFASRLASAVGARWALGRSTETTAFRLVHAEGDGIAGIAVDVYDEHLLAHFFSSETLVHKDAILDLLMTLAPRGIYLKVHPKQSNTLVNPRTSDLAPSGPVRGIAAADPLVIREGGLAFRVRLGDGLKTGIFLDQRDNRRRVRDFARGKRVLNLFAYTCAFSVAAAAGGARATVNVDASKGALEWGVANLEENGLMASAHQMIADDALVWLKHAAKRGERYDLVVLDPPSYATTKTSRFSAADDFSDLAARALALLAPGGSLLASTNHRGISAQKFRKYMHEAGRISGSTIVQLKDLPCPTDFPAPMGAASHLKSVIVSVK